MNITPLPDRIEGKGEVSKFVFHKKMTTEHAYLFEVVSEWSIHFEVIRRVSSPKCIDFENRVYSETEGQEYYPKASSFGTLGWSFYSLEKAVEKLNEITNEKDSTKS